MTRDIVVVGAGGFGRETLDVIEAINSTADVASWRVRGVVDDAPSAVALDRLGVRGYAHIGGLDSMLSERAGQSYVVAIGSPVIRQTITNQLERAGWNAVTLVHPASVVGSQTVIGNGTIICGGVQLSTNTRLGRHVHLNPGAVIGHDALLGRCVSVNPGAVVSGEVDIADRVLIGAAATVLQGLTIGEDAIVGAGACVTRSVNSGSVVMGVPARSRGGAI